MNTNTHQRNRCHGQVIATIEAARAKSVAALNRLLDAHEIVLEDARPLAREAAERGDEGTNDLIVSQLVRTTELQSWFVGEHLRASDDPQ